MKSLVRVSIVATIALVCSCASVENERVEVSQETNAVVVTPLPDGQKETAKEQASLECERVYRVVVVHTYELEQKLTGQDGKLLLGAQTVAGTLLRLAAGPQEQKPWQPDNVEGRAQNEEAAASLGVIAAALAFVDAESRRKARNDENSPETLYTDEKRLMKIQHCLDIAKVTDRDATARARSVRRLAESL